MKKKLLVVLLTAVLAIAFTACGGSGSSGGGSAAGGGEGTSIADLGDVTWTYAHTGRNGDELDQYAELLKKYMEEAFPNVTLELSGSAKLGSDPERMELVREDGVEFAQFSSLEFGAAVPAADALGIAYILPQDPEKLSHVVTEGEAVNYINSILEEQGYIAMDWYPESYSCISSNKELTADLSSLKGQKIRAMNTSIDIANVKGLGASPQALDYGEIYTGLQLGTVDGQMNPLPIIEANKFYEVQKYILLSYHECVLDVTCVSPSLWASFTEEDQAKIKEVFAKVNQEAVANRAASNEKSLKAIQEGNPDITIVDMTDEQRAEWAKTVGEEAKKQYLENTGEEEGQKVLDMLAADGQ